MEDIQLKERLYSLENEEVQVELTESQKMLQVQEPKSEEEDK